MTRQTGGLPERSRRAHAGDATEGDDSCSAANSPESSYWPLLVDATLSTSMVRNTPTIFRSAWTASSCRPKE